MRWRLEVCDPEKSIGPLGIAVPINAHGIFPIVEVQERGYQKEPAVQEVFLSGYKAIRYSTTTTRGRRRRWRATWMGFRHQGRGVQRRW